VKARTRRQVKQYLAQFRGEARYQEAVLGDGTGKVSAGIANHCYARIRGVPLVVYNDRTGYINNLPVVVGYDDLEPSLLQVLTVKHYAGVTYPGNFSLAPHHETHEFLNPSGGQDPIYFGARQYLPLRVGHEGMAITVQAGYVQLPNGWRMVQRKEPVDLTPYRPTTGARWAVIGLTLAGEIAVTEGAVMTSVLNLRATDIPPLPEGHYGLAAIRLYAGQTRIVETVYGSDVIDLRDAVDFSSGAGPGGDMRRSVYDQDDDGVVDAAQTVAWSGITGRPLLYFSGTLSAPPTSAEVTALAGAASGREAGYSVLLRASGSARGYLAVSDGAAWWLTPLLKAR
jgi:hypothetical protein